MYKKHPCFLPPNYNHIGVWRYMDFTKLVHLLEFSSLYFSRADKFKDPFEGSYPQRSVEAYNEFIRQNVPNILPEEKEKFFKVAEKARIGTYINCWHVNYSESAAMWDLYLKSNEGIAVKSTYSRLKESIIDDRDVFIGMVNYLDYEKQMISLDNSFNPFLCKRLSFEHERELRCIFQEHSQMKLNNSTDKEQNYPAGVCVKVDCEKLIEKIYVAPTAPDWIVDLIKLVLKKYNIHKDVAKSTLYNLP